MVESWSDHDLAMRFISIAIYSLNCNIHSQVVTMHNSLFFMENMELDKSETIQYML